MLRSLVTLFNRLIERGSTTKIMEGDVAKSFGEEVEVDGMVMQ